MGQYFYLTKFTPPYRESIMNGQQWRSTWLIDFLKDNRITVAGQRLIFTDFAFQPSL